MISEVQHHDRCLSHQSAARSCTAPPFRCFLTISAACVPAPWTAPAFSERTSTGSKPNFSSLSEGVSRISRHVWRRCCAYQCEVSFHARRTPQLSWFAACSSPTNTSICGRPGGLCEFRMSVPICYIVTPFLASRATWNILLHHAI